MYRPDIDVGSLDAIDVHVHIEADGHGGASLPPALAAAASAYFRSDGVTPDVEGVAAYYRARRMAAVVFTVDASTRLGHPPLSSREIIERAADQADVLVPFCSVDPLRGPEAVEQLHRLVVDHGAQGVKLHPTVQGFDPSADEHRPLWEAIRDLDVPVIVHTGQTGIGSGLPGGAGLRLRYSDPMLLDDVLADLPGLRMVFAHPSVPWQDAAISIATHKPEVHIDLSGWSPRRFPAQLVKAAGTFLQDRVLFGSDFPLLTPERWRRDFEELDIPDVARGKILIDNAARLLRLAVPSTDKEEER